MRFRRLLILPTIATLLVLHSVVVYAEAPTPDIPEVNGFVPTQMADVEEPHPFTNRVIVAEPVANAYGTAEITYPIDLPAGRNGLQPNIDLTYSSSNGASVFGYGWTMQQPAITIDTRWGVPRYDRQYETEIYTLNGTQIVQKDGNPNLTLPYQTHIQQQRHNGNVSFMSRDTKNKDVITRHGNSPRNYWWSVVDRNGTTYYYGKYQKDATVNDACILTDETDNIGYWALAEVVDLHGNYMRYEYEKEEGTDLYMTNIYYTGHYNEHGTTDLLPAYKIKFHYNTYYGDGLQSDCRLGFIRRQNRLICCIEKLWLQNYADTIYKTFVRHSFFMDGSFFMNRTPFLISIADYAIPEYSYYDQIPSNYGYWCGLEGQDVFSELRLSKTNFSYNNRHYYDIFEADEHIIKDNNSDYKNLNESRNMDWSLGGTLTVGVGPDAWITNISAGGNYDFSKSKGDVDMTLMDMNGDGLTDKVYVKNDSIYYRKQVHSDTISFFAAEQNTGIPAKSLNHDVSKTNQWGLQAGAAVPGEVAGANISGGWSVTNTQTSSYFADVNGDGLPDYIDDGTVYFNSLKSNDHFIKHNGEYVIQTDSSDCQSNFYYDGAVALGQDCYLNYKLVDTFSVNPHPQNESEVCELCEYITRQLLYYDEFSYWFDVINCSKYCDINLDCSEWEWNMNGDEFRERCETYPEICTRCLGQYLQYGAESQEYQSCRDFYCIFNGQRMICDTCRERCIEDSVDCEACIEENCAYIEMYDDNEGRTVYYVYGVPVCEDCIPYCQDNLDSEECYWCRRDYCNLVQCDPEYGGYCYNGMEICTECQDRCNDWSYPDDCNRCKRENQCKGYIPEDLFDEYMSSFYDDYSRDGMLALIEQLQERGVICEACRTTCRNDPAKCIPCLHKYCNYRAEEDIVDELVYERKQEYLLSHPKAYFVQDYNKVYVYDTMTVCRKIDNIDPNIEAVRVWVAPMNGTIRIKSHVQLMEDTSLLRRQSRSADGVRCVIQHDKQVQVVATSPKHLVPTATDIIATLNIPANDYSMHSGEYANIVVHKGDVLSFRVMSRTTHDFDNVNWTQQIHYITAGDSYHSSNDYICSSIETFEYDELGEATIEYWADVQSGGTAAVSIMRGSNSVNSYIVTSALNTHASVTIPNIHPDKDNALYLTLYSIHPEKVHVRAKVTFRYGDNLSKSVTKWLVPDVSFTRDYNEIHDDVYYDLFGPLYRGWGQYAFNNKHGTAVIPLDSLYNPYKKIYEENHNDTAAYRDSIRSMAEMDTLLLMKSPDSMDEAFSQLGLYNPLEPLWIEMRADAEYYQWEAYGKVARVGQNIMSNTRDEVQQAATASPIADEGFDFYDSDVPLATNGARPMTVRKESKTKQWNLSFGANIRGAGIGNTIGQGTYKLQTDYMDMNGDRYPDIVREQAIQYTKPWGGLGETRAVDAYLHETQTTTYGGSFSGCHSNTVKLPGSPKSDRFKTSASGSFGIGAIYSNSENSVVLQDINADGLPDKLVYTEDSVYIYANLGYKFALYGIVQSFSHIYQKLKGFNASYSISSSANAGFALSGNWEETVNQIIDMSQITNDMTSMYQMSISAGCSLSSSTNSTQRRLVDINGDGRLDLIWPESFDNKIYVIYNALDKSFRGSIYDINGDIIQQSTTNNAGFNLALTGGYTFFGVMKVCAGVQTTPISISQTFGTHDLIDMNGDGLPDLVRVANNKIYVRYNTSGKTGLLKSIKTLNGKRIDLDYTLSQPTSGQPYRQMLLTSVRNIDENATADAGVPVMEKRIVYADPHYDPSERQSYGYGSVTTYDMYPATADDTARIYRKHVQRYQNQEYAEHGKLIYDAVLDSLDNLYTEYELGTIYYDASGHETDNTCQDTKIRVGKEAHLTRYYEGTAEPITTAKIYDYDDYHNVTRYEDFGDSLIANDDLLTTITYENRAQYINRNLISLPTTVLVKAAGQNVRKTRSEYSTEGKLSRQVLSSLANGSDSCVTDYLYNDLGLLSHVTLPPNQNNQRGTISITYDSFMYSLPQEITNHFGQTQRYTYSTQWQKPLLVISPAGDTISYEYDSFGRLTTITTPFERNIGRHSVKYEYGVIDYNHNDIYVDTKTYTEDDSTLQRSLYDSRGLLLQRQKRRASGFVVTDRNAYDCFGRILKTYSPTTANNLSNSYISQNRQLVASYTYDILDRQTSVRWNDNNHNISIIQYLLGNDYWGIKRFKTITTDENGGQWQTFTSPQGWVTTTIAPDNATTRFVYDAMGQITASTDPDSLTTTHTYDGLGRRIQRIHPDAGINRWGYDPAGNIVVTQTQQQISDGEQTTYEYNYDRLISVHQSSNDALDIIYEYDSVGRMVKRTDLSGIEQFVYDPMGNVIQSDRLIALPSEQRAYKFTAQYKYDSFGRMKLLTLPDGKNIRYNYTDGLLESIHTRKLPYRQNALQLPPLYTFYLHECTYDTYDRPIHQIYGNYYSVNYAYDSVRSWLTSKTTYNDSQSLQELQYSYDAVGNIIAIQQNADSVHWLGGQYMQEFQYDAQNRLRRADMISDYWGLYSNYNLTYSPSGMIGIKSCDDMLWNYWHGYCSANDKIINHQVRSIYDMENDATTFYQWDAAGRLQNIYIPCAGDIRHHRWSESGQLAATIDNEHCAFYTYDGNGNRAYKLTGNTMLDQYNAGQQFFHAYLNDAVVYVNPYFTISRKNYTRHIFNGTQRIATEIGTSDLSDCIDTTAAGMERLTNARAYMQSLFADPIELHSDTGTTFVDIDGEAYDELQWQCFGGDRLWQITIACDSDILLPILRRDSGAADTRVSGKYFYHTDHLGSANWVTKGDEAVQFIHYMPYGEMWYNQRGSAYNERYKYTGKERDEETGNDYFGARYYAAYTPMWLSPDPLMDKYPGISPYAYCSWNPMKYVDPDGKEFINKLATTMQINKNSSLSQEQRAGMINTNAYLSTNLMKRDALGINNVFELFAHGSPRSIINRFTRITDASQLNTMLLNSSQYLTSANNNSSVFVFYACYTGQGENSIAQQFSGIKEVFGSVVIAPTAAVSIDKNGNEYIKGGEWNVFFKGKKIDTINGDKGMMTKYVKQYLSDLNAFLKSCNQKLSDDN